MDRKNIKTRDVLITILFTIYLILPLLKMIKVTSMFINIYEYQIMEIIAIIGIYFFAFEIYRISKKGIDKKQIIKELLPILIFIAYLIWTLISCIFALDKEKAFYGDLYRKDGYITYLIYAGFFLCAYLISSEKIRKYLLSLFIIIVVLNIILINLTSNYIEMLKVFYIQNIQQGVFYNSNHYGYYLTIATLVVCILFVTENNKVLKLLYGLAYIVISYNLILNNTFGSYLACSITILAFMIYCIYNKKYIIFSIVSLLIFIIMSCITQYKGENLVFNNFKNFFRDTDILLDDTQKSSNWEEAGSGRARLWKYGVIIFMQKPILGYGAENLESEYAKYNINQDRPHNLIIQLATTSGLPGLLLYISGIGLMLFRGFKRLNKESDIYIVLYFSVIAYLISAMFGNSMYYTSPYFFILLGFLNKKFEKKY